MDGQTLRDIRAIALKHQVMFHGRYGSGSGISGQEELKKKMEERNKARKDKIEYKKKEKGFAKLVGIPDKAIKVIFQLLEPFPCTSVAFALAHPRFYNIRRAYYKPVKDLYSYDPPWTIRTPTQLLYVVIKEFMGSELHFCYSRRQFIPWSRRGMTIEEKKGDRCPENATPKSCGLCCGNNVGPLSSD